MKDAEMMAWNCQAKMDEIDARALDEMSRANHDWVEGRIGQAERRRRTMMAIDRQWDESHAAWVAAGRP